MTHDSSLGFVFSFVCFQTYLNNPQFCLRHHSPGPISVVLSLLLPSSSTTTGISHSELALNLTVATFPAGTADPNPFTDAENDAEKRKQHDVARKNEKESEARRKKEELEKARAQAQLMGQPLPSSSASPLGGGVGVASLRIKSKSDGKSGSKKKKSENMFADVEVDGNTAGADSTQPHDDVPRVNPLTTDYELVSQTTFNGDLYKSARLIHLFLPDVQPKRSYFVLPSTSVPGQESEFQIQAFGASPTAELRFDPCHLNAVADGIDMTALASRRASAAFGASIASHKVKKLPKDGAARPKHKKETHR